MSMTLKQVTDTPTGVMAHEEREFEIRWLERDYLYISEKTSSGRRVLLKNPNYTLFFDAPDGSLQTADRTKRPMLRMIKPDDPFNLAPEVTSRLLAPWTIILNTERLSVSRVEQIDSVVGSSDRRDLHLSAGKFDGLESVKVSFRWGEHGLFGTYVIVPKLGNAVVSIERADGPFGSEDNLLDQTASGSIAEVSPGVFFPKSVTLTQRVKGKLHLQETLSISCHSVNNLIPGDFDLKGVGIPPDVVISNSTDSPTRLDVWNGTTLSPLDSNEVAKIQQSRSVAAPAVQKNYLGLSFALLAIAILVYSILHFSKRRTR
jgi:hypothetical protein